MFHIMVKTNDLELGYTNKTLVSKEEIIVVHSCIFSWCLLRYSFRIHGACLAIDFMQLESMHSQCFIATRKEISKRLAMLFPCAIWL